MGIMARRRQRAAMEMKTLGAVEVQTELNPHSDSVLTPAEVVPPAPDATDAPGDVPPAPAPVSAKIKPNPSRNR